MIKFWIILLSTGLISRVSFAQETQTTPPTFHSWEFYQYLIDSGLQENAITWLENYPDSLRNDTLNNLVNFELVKLYVSKKEIGKACKLVQNITFFQDSCVLNYALYLSFGALDTLSINRYLNLDAKCLGAQDKLEALIALDILQQKNINHCQIPKTLNNSDIFLLAQEYMMHKKKSQFLAGLLSALLPGLGKLYMGYPYQAVSSFSMNFVLGAVLLEGLVKGSAVWQWALPLPLFAVFYAGNIYGSIVLAKKREIDFRNNTNEKIKTYYLNKLLLRK